MVGCCMHGNESSGSIKDGELLVSELLSLTSQTLPSLMMLIPTFRENPCIIPDVIKSDK
jgi:hypothetical protein